MNWSISFAYRLGLGFHALNNEGADGSNLMQPRRIDVGNATYDGISGEIIRRHVLEHFVNVCGRKNPQINMLPLSEGLHPDRGPIGIRVAAKREGVQELTDETLYPSIRRAIVDCAVLDVGGYLAAWKEGNQKKYVAEKPYIDAECAPYKDADPVKRESCFDVAWLISESPEDHTVTQHSAFRATAAENSRYSQTMRSNTYGGVIRADLHRIGTDDYWYLQSTPDGAAQPRLAVTPPEQLSRQKALVEAIVNFIVAPTGAKVAGWAPHVFLTEGAVLLTSARTAPFCSPIKIDLSDTETPVKPNSGYREAMRKLGSGADSWAFEFTDAQGLIAHLPKVLDKLEGRADAEKSPQEG